MTKPLIAVQDKNPLADALEANTQDLTYVKGYSDKRQQIDSDLARQRNPSVDLQYRLHYVTMWRPNGKPDGQTATRFRALGYKPLPYDTAAELGIEVPIHAERTVEGWIKVGDAVLFYTGADNAAKIEAQGRSAIDERTSVDSTASALHQEADRMGSVGQGTEVRSLTWHKSEANISKG